MKDLYHECNTQGMSAAEFESIFCNRCRNRECQRAGWATSNWDKRISSQVDRLLINPNIAGQSDSSRWESIINFEPVTSSADWTPEVIIETPPREDAPAPAPAPVQASTPAPAPTPTPAREGRKALNTPVQSGVMIGGAPPPPQPQTLQSDPWAVSPREVKVGGTFKMGK